eukprot:CAMPEP_0173364212 /NCGR_PEP_ID=MMETSP1144-20121109/22845_1 /TAXON_ID=483371 /ORGANISM="non described non described, Strain CCMP2298" /LENGTH=132 /DNA_ID=CAMNT_0014314307 /DNA_START=441 /DNA_END=835 /DNA_ORIENTATION=+
MRSTSCATTSRLLRNARCTLPRRATPRSKLSTPPASSVVDAGVEAEAEAGVGLGAMGPHIRPEPEPEPELEAEVEAELGGGAILRQFSASSCIRASDVSSSSNLGASNSGSSLSSACACACICADPSATAPG